MSKPIKPIPAPAHQRTRGEAVPIGDHLVELPQGLCCIMDAPGITTTLVERPGIPPMIGLIVYDPEQDDALDHGFGYIAQLDATIAREIAASLLRLAAQLDGGRLS